MIRTPGRPAQEYQLDLCFGFVGYEKAFDTIEHVEHHRPFQSIKKMKAMSALLKTSTQRQHQGLI